MKCFLCSILLFFSFDVYSQHINLLLARNYSSDINKLLYTDASDVHTSMKPILKSDLNFIPDSLVRSYLPVRYKNWYIRKFLGEHLIVLKGDNYKVIASPIINFSKGKELNESISTFTII